MAGAFGDSEPEDAWNVDDPVVDQVRNLARRIELLDGRPPPSSTPGTVAGVLDEIGKRAVAVLVERDDLTRRDLIRLSLILTDVGTVRGRLS
jgi:hypothetical protein